MDGTSWALARSSPLITLNCDDRSQHDPRRKSGLGPKGPQGPAHHAREALARCAPRALARYRPTDPAPGPLDLAEPEQLVGDDQVREFDPFDLHDGLVP